MNVPSSRFAWLVLTCACCMSPRASSDEGTATPSVTREQASFAAFSCKQTYSRSVERDNRQVLAIDPRLQMLWVFHERPGSNFGEADRFFNLGAGDTVWTIQGRWKSFAKSGAVEFESTAPHPILQRLALRAVTRPGERLRPGELAESLDLGSRSSHQAAGRQVLVALDPEGSFFSTLEQLRDCTVQALSARRE